MAVKRFPIENAEEFRSRLREARERAGLRQGEAGSKLGQDQGSVSEWETGKVEPSPGAIVKIAKLYGVSIDWLLTGEEPVTNYIVNPRLPQWLQELLPRISELDAKSQAAARGALLGVLNALAPTRAVENTKPPPRKARAGAAGVKRG